jgi:hypothetical protein
MTTSIRGEVPEIGGELMERANEILRGRGVHPGDATARELSAALAEAQRESEAAGGGSTGDARLDGVARDFKIEAGEVDEDSARVHVLAMLILKEQGKEATYTNDEYVDACGEAERRLGLRVDGVHRGSRG